MRIVHAVENVAGVPVALVRAQRALGHQAVAVLTSRLRGPASGAVDLDRVLAGGAVIRKLRRAQLVSHLAANYDVFHFHFLGSFMRFYADVAALRALGKTIIFHLHGCDIRNPSRVRHGHEVSACAECPIPCLTPAKRALPVALHRYADAVIVSTPDLLEFVPEAHYIPNPVDSRWWRAPVEPSTRLSSQVAGWTVVHAPTNQIIKGTHHVEAAIQILRTAGMDVRLHLLEGVSREELRQVCLHADIAVDQVLVGWVGSFALEMMALGKPVVAYIRPELEGWVQEMPVASASPTTLADVLRDLMLSPNRRAELAMRGPAYVEAYHDLLVVGKRVLQVYEHSGRHSARAI